MLIFSSAELESA